jgi:hypothetical protein
MRRESSNEIKCNIRNSAVLQHMKNNNFTYQANNRLLQHPLLTVVVLWQYHKNFSISSNTLAHQKVHERGYSTSPQLAKTMSTITSKRLTTQARRVMLIRSKGWPSVTSSSRFYKAKWTKKNNQNINKTVFGSKRKVPSQQVQKQVIIFHQSYA